MSDTVNYIVPLPAAPTTTYETQNQHQITQALQAALRTERTYFKLLREDARANFRARVLDSLIHNALHALKKAGADDLLSELLARWRMLGIPNNVIVEEVHTGQGTTLVAHHTRMPGPDLQLPFQSRCQLKSYTAQHGGTIIRYR